MEAISLQTASASTTGSILRAAEKDVGVAVSLLKKAVSADQNLVNTLLQSADAHSGRLNIQA